jgi:hypothetical protein
MPSLDNIPMNVRLLTFYIDFIRHWDGKPEGWNWPIGTHQGTHGKLSLESEGAQVDGGNGVLHGNCFGRNGN